MDKWHRVLVSSFQEFRAGLERRVGFQEADDLAQDTYERVLRKAFQEIISPIALLQHVAKHLQIDAQRRRSKVQFESTNLSDPNSTHALTPVDELSPERRMISEQQLQLLQEAIDNLPPRCRHAFVLARIHGVPHEEVAADMKISVSMVEKHVANALRQCREYLSQ